MKIYRAKDYNDMSRKAANIISAQVIMKPGCVLGLATGSTPIGAYRQLVEWYKKGDLDFSEVTTVNLDEYRGLTRENDQSYYYFMNENLFDHINIDKSRTFLPDGMEADSDKACRDYNEIIQSVGGVDLLKQTVEANLGITVDRYEYIKWYVKDFHGEYAPLLFYEVKP